MKKCHFVDFFRASHFNRISAFNPHQTMQLQMNISIWTILKLTEPIFGGFCRLDAEPSNFYTFIIISILALIFHVFAFIWCSQWFFVQFATFTHHLFVCLVPLILKKYFFLSKKSIFTMRTKWRYGVYFIYRKRSYWPYKPFGHRLCVVMYADNKKGNVW